MWFGPRTDHYFLIRNNLKNIICFLLPLENMKKKYYLSVFWVGNWGLRGRSDFCTKYTLLILVGLHRILILPDIRPSDIRYPAGYLAISNKEFIFRHKIYIYLGYLVIRHPDTGYKKGRISGQPDIQFNTNFRRIRWRWQDLWVSPPDREVGRLSEFSSSRHRL